jgi:predicted RNA-binding protein (virulence factor B family)
VRRAYMAKKGKTDRDKADKRPFGRSSRIVAKPKVDEHSQEGPGEFQEGQCVELLIGDRTEIGCKAVINNSREGLLYKNEVFQPLRKGQRISGFIKKVRSDGKIDLCLQKRGTEKVDDVAARIIDELKAHGGFIALTDKSRPEDVYRLFGVSKKTYKKAIGALYKERIIVIEDRGIGLVQS